MTQKSFTIRIGISSCLLGQKVRYNGDHKRNSYIVEVLSKHFEWAPICPEVEVGLGVPRDTLRLVLNKNEKPRLIVTNTKEDITDRMKFYAQDRLQMFEPFTLHGYILKKGSPSCGLKSVSYYRNDEPTRRRQTGLFAEQLVQSFPLLPVEEEGRLSNVRLRKNFLERVFAYHRLSELILSNPSHQDIISFHTKHKMQLLAHHRDNYTKLGQWVAKTKEIEKKNWLDTYASLFMKTLKFPTTPKKHANVMYQLMGFLKDKITFIDKEELIEKIEKYRLGKIPFSVPITLLNHHFLHHPIPWIKGQTYLDPYLEEILVAN